MARAENELDDTATTEIYTNLNTLSLHDALPIWFKSYLPIIIAVLIRAYKMSQSVGWAMESRGLNLQGVRRTYRIQLKMRLSDWIILAVTVAATAGSIWLMLWQF